MKSPLVTIKKCSGQSEAAFLKAYLETHGLAVWDGAERMPSWLGRYSILSRGVSLRVRPQDADRAQQLLDHPPECELSEDEAGLTAMVMPFDPSSPPEKCPLCGSGNLVVWDTPWLIRKMNDILFLGGAHSSGHTWICRDCDWDSKRR